MKMWEYKVIDLVKNGVPVSPVDEESELDLLGQQGWELVGVTGNHYGYNGSFARAYLKRLKADLE